MAENWLVMQGFLKILNGLREPEKGVGIWHIVKGQSSVDFYLANKQLIMMKNFAEKTDFDQYAIHIDKNLLITLKYGLGLMPPSPEHSDNANRLLLMLNQAQKDNSFNKSRKIDLCIKCQGSGRIKSYNIREEPDIILCPCCLGEGSKIFITTTFQVFLDDDL